MRIKRGKAFELVASMVRLNRPLDKRESDDFHLRVLLGNDRQAQNRGLRSGLREAVGQQAPLRADLQPHLADRRPHPLAKILPLVRFSPREQEHFYHRKGDRASAVDFCEAH